MLSVVRGWSVLRLGLAAVVVLAVGLVVLFWCLQTGVDPGVSGTVAALAAAAVGPLAFRLAEPGGGSGSAPGRAKRRRRGVRALLVAIELDARSSQLPGYLPVGADVLQLSRRVRVRRESREYAPTAGAELGAENPVGDSVDRALFDDGVGRAYALPADQTGEDHVVEWDQLAEEHRLIVVLADPGLGKTWLIRTEAQRLAAAAVSGLDAGTDLDELIVPIRARCDELLDTGSSSLAEAVLNVLQRRYALSNAVEQWLVRQLDRGRVALLLDALDELHRPVGDLADLLSAWPALRDRPSGGAADRVRPARVVIASRISGYGGVPVSGLQWKQVELQPFDQDDVDAVVDAWNLPSEAKTRLRDGLGQSAVRAMARIPLLLAMLCAISHQPEPLPRVRHQLYERLLRWFLTRDRTAKTGGHANGAIVDVEHLLDLLAPVAAEFAGRPGGWVDLMHRGELARTLEAQPGSRVLAANGYALVDHLATDLGLLVPAAPLTDGRSAPYLFLHRTVAEYLVARHLALQPVEHWWEQIHHRVLFDPDWDQVIRLLGGLLDSPSTSGTPADLIDRLCALESDPFLFGVETAAHVIAELPQRTVPTICDSIDHIIKRAVERAHGPTAADTIGVLTALGPPRTPGHTEHLLRLLDHTNAEVANTAVESLPRTVVHDQHLRDSLYDMAAGDDGNGRRRQRALRALIPSAAYDQQIRNVVLRVALTETDTMAEREAYLFIHALAKMAPTDDQIWDALLHRVSSDSNGNHRARTAAIYAAFENLADTDQIVRDALLNIATATNPHSIKEVAAGPAGQYRRSRVVCRATNRSSSVDSEIVKALIRTIDTPSPDVREAMVRIAMRHTDTTTRVNAVEALGRVISASCNIRDTVLGIAADTTCPERLRAAAVHALGGIIETDRDAYRQVHQAANHDAPTLRAAAAEALEPMNSREQDTRDTLLRMAMNDADADARRAAVTSLSQLVGRDEGVRRAVLAIAADTKCPVELRMTAMLALEDVIDREPEAYFQALRAANDSDSVIRSAAVIVLERLVAFDQRVRDTFLSIVRTYGTDGVTANALAIVVDTDEYVRDSLIDVVITCENRFACAHLIDRMARHGPSFALLCGRLTGAIQHEPYPFPLYESLRLTARKALPHVPSETQQDVAQNLDKFSRLQAERPQSSTSQTDCPSDSSARMQPEIASDL